MPVLEQDYMTKQVLDNLQDSDYTCKTLEKLSGGYANFIYRGVLINSLKDGSKTIIIKHSEAYAAFHKAFELSIDRCIIEYKIISALQQTLPSTSYSNVIVETPKALSFSESTKTQIHCDFTSSIDLKTYLLTQKVTQSQASDLGFALGPWTRTFHHWGRAPEQEQLRLSVTGNQKMKDVKYYLNYERLRGKVDQYPEILRECEDILEDIIRDTRTIFNEDDGCIIHGDFWTGNVLLNSSQEGAMKLLVVDWEFSQLNSIVFDLGQMLAELYQLKHFRDIDSAIWIIAAFVQGYGSVSEDDAFKVLIHIGTHLICWGSNTPGWGTEDQVREVVKIGRDFMIKGWNRNKTFFEHTPLSCLFTSI